MRGIRVVIRCRKCAQPVATVSEAKLQKAAGYTLWRGRSTPQLLEKVTDAAEVECITCENAAIVAASMAD